PLGGDDLAEPFDDVRQADAEEVEALAARQGRDGGFLEFGGRQDELDRRGRLFAGVQQGVGRLLAEHGGFRGGVAPEQGPAGERVGGRVGRRGWRGAWISRAAPASPLATARQTSQASQGVAVGPFSQLRALARMRAVEVLPTPRAPVNRYACATRVLSSALTRARGTGSWPTTSGKCCGR